MASGLEHYLLLTKNGEVYSWGKPIHGKTESRVSEPQKIIFPEHTGPIVCIVAGGEHAAAVTKFGKTFTWGKTSSSGRHSMGYMFGDRRGHDIKCIPEFEAAIPETPEWKIMKWPFLGKLDENSFFFKFHVELLFHLLLISESWVNTPVLRKKISLPQQHVSSKSKNKCVIC